MNYLLIEDRNLIIPALNYFSAKKVISCDTETNNKLVPMEGYLRLLQISDGVKTILIDLKECFPEYWNGQAIKDEPEILKLKELLENQAIVKVFHNAKFDVKWILYHLGILVEPVFCTMLSSQLINYDERHSLKEVLRRKLVGVKLDKTEQNTDWTGKLSKNKLEYAAGDVIYLFDLYTVLRQELIDFDLVKVAKLEFDCVKIYAEMELDGVKVNRELYAKKIVEMQRLRDIAHSRLMEFLADEDHEKAVQPSLFGEPDKFAGSFLLSSHEQVAKKLISKGVPILNKFHPEVVEYYQKNRTEGDKETKKEEIKAAVEAVQQRYERNHRPYATGTGEPALSHLVDQFDALKPLDEFRKTEKMVTSYGESLMSHLKAYSGHDRLHPDWNIIGTPTGRNSSKNVSVQNIPDKPVQVNGQEYDLKVREAFDYPEGTVGISADMPNIELRIMADKSGDEAMINAFVEGKDLHSDTASRIFNIPYDDLLEESPNYKKNKDARKRAKVANFALAYGAHEYNLYKKMDCTIEEARAIKDKYFETYFGLSRWLNSNADYAVSNLQIRSGWGRRQVFKPYENNKQRGAIKRSGFNSPIQMGASDMMKHCLILVYKAIKPYGAKIVTVIHDEFNVQCPKEHAETVRALVSQKMTEGCRDILSRVPVEVSAKIVSNWSEK